MKKKILIISICYLILVIIITLFINIFAEHESKDTSKIQVIATLYPEYDFVSRIGGDKVDVTLLLGPGVEAHTYEPSVKNMKEISDSDIFIYTGNAMEPWAQTVIDSITTDCAIVDCSKNIELIDMDKFMEEYSILDEDTHIHNKEENDYDYDGHIWLNPQNCLVMIDTICKELVKLDPENKNYYETNAENYKIEIEALDKEIEDTLQENNIDILVFGGEFAYAYFCERYNLKVATCYTACGEDSEPSVSRIKKIIDLINSNNISKVFYEELSEGTVANMISEETNAKGIVFNTIHNVSKEENKAGVNYVSIMKENLEKICSK
jgi:zinc transport system substrate-binding protein